MIADDLVPVYTTSTGEKIVYGRELHNALDVKSNYRDWVKNRISECDAIENEDYQSFAKNLAKGGRPQTDHIIRLNIAKEMAMLERNDKGKQVRRYFIQIEKKYKENIRDDNRIIGNGYSLKDVVDSLEPAARLLRMNDASRILMLENFYKGQGISIDFLPHYELNDNRQLKAATTLLKENGCEISAVKFNSLMIKNGLLEERERPSSNGKTKKFKSLTESGTEYGENAVNPHNQKEVQPLYYSDKFMELYEDITR